MDRVVDQRVDGDETIGEPALDDLNAVTIEGTLGAGAERRRLPSGDELLTLRVVVRSAGGRVDTLPVQLGPAPPPGHRPGRGQLGRRRLDEVQRLASGSRVRVEGALRRRWWRGPSGPASAVAVDASSVTPIP